MEFSEFQQEPLPKNTPIDMEKWRSIIDGCDPDKENQKKYCLRLGINLNTFTYIRGKLSKKSKKSQSNFIPVTLNRFTDQKSQTTYDLTLENSQGFKLHFSSLLSLDQLTKIFKLFGCYHD